MSAPACTPNIGPIQRRRRRVLGIGALSVGLALAIGGSLLGLGVLARVALAPVFFAGFLGVFQAREHT